MQWKLKRNVIRKDVGNVTKNGKALLAKIHEIRGEGVSEQMRSVKIKRM